MRASEKAYQSLHQDIVAWRIAPGTLLAEVELSERLGVSRTPIREALARLSAEGLTTAKGGRGVVVTEVSLDAVRELYELRETLEVKAAELAAQRGDPTVFEGLAQRFRLAQKNLAQQNLAQQTSSTHASTEAYYQLSAELDAALNQHCGNARLAATLNTLRPLLARARRMAQEHPDRLAETAAEHAAIARAIAAGNPRLAAASTVVHLNNSLQHILQGLPSTDRQGSTP
ncbi:GntR family transcriptional regulator [Psychromicrobium xiongbiense]|uniref:GntR family transcriptional regulator n=1 Tax=Psychromicrobium xiongbiense TaxID=3051184 RepID=UPI002553BA78|nr:GntR family transcriptional regulator [Psychromicrobium sp. YIM S02556]